MLASFRNRFTKFRWARRDARRVQYDALVADFANLAELDPRRVARVLYGSGGTAPRFIADAAEYLRRRRMHAGATCRE